MSATSATNVDPQQRLIGALPDVERILAAITRRNALDQDDADDFGGWAKARLTDGDYAIIRKFQGRSSFTTYLTVVLANLFRDYRNSAWGRWRPSAAARRLGPVAVRLEELLHRDGASLRESIEMLRATGVASSDAELARLAASLPARDNSPDVSIEDTELPAPEQADAATSARERQIVAEAIQQVVGQLADEDRVILRMRFWDDVSVADIARALRLEQKPLYRRLEGMQAQLREQLERRGITRELAKDVLTEEAPW